MKTLIERVVDKKIHAQQANDGDGVKIFRSIGSPLLPQLDPFLLFDEINSEAVNEYIGGFPSHPHRGFETVTYMLDGAMHHKDSMGHEGMIGSGDVQWMTAGAGVIHSEIPEQQQGKLWGFQIWINLPSHQKMQYPRYQEIPSKEIPEIVLEAGAECSEKWCSGKVRVIAGHINHNGLIVQGAITDIVTQPLLLDVQLNKGEWQTQLPESHIAFVYVYSGELSIGEIQVQQQQLAILSKGDLLRLAAIEKPIGALVLAAAALNEPIVRSGPFVMNTQEQIQQAFSDYRSGQFEPHLEK